MNRAVALFLVIGSLFTVIIVAAARPAWMSDGNQFLAEFINHELLNVLGVILAITLASIAQMHLKLNDIAEKIQAEVMQATRAELKSSAVWLIAIFIAALVLVFIKPLLVDAGGLESSFPNGIGLWLLLFAVLILADTTMAIFKIEPLVNDKNTPAEGP